MSLDLSTGFIDELQSKTVDELKQSQPVLRITNLKYIPPKSTARRTATVSDGQHDALMIFSTELNELVDSKEVAVDVVIQVTNLDIRDHSSKRIMLALAVVVKGRMSKNTATTNSTQTGRAPLSNVTNMLKAEMQRLAISDLARFRPGKDRILVRACANAALKTAASGNRFLDVALRDASGTIRAIAYGKNAERLEGLFQEDKAYYLENFRVGRASYTKVDKNNLELVLHDQATVKEAPDNSDVPKLAFTPLAKLPDLAADDLCDVLVVVHNVEDVGMVSANRGGRETYKRDLLVVDASGFSVRTTLWGQQAQEFPAQGNPVVAFRNIKVTSFGVRSLSLTSVGTMTMPETEESRRVKAWYDSDGAKREYTSHGAQTVQTQVEIDKTTRLCLDQVKESETLGKDGENGMFVCRATLIDIRTDKATYPACEKCHKKLVEVHGSAGRCEMCHKTVPVTYRYNLPAVFGDSTNRAWFTLFNGSAERLLGMNANDFMSIKEKDVEKFTRMAKGVAGRSFWMACRAKTSEYQSITTTRYTIEMLDDVDYRAETEQLMKSIRGRDP